MNAKKQPITDDKSTVSADAEYTRLTAHLDYLDEKIFKFLSLYTTIAIAIIGGTFFLCIQIKSLPQSAKPLTEDLTTWAMLINYLMTLISLGFGWFITHHLAAWRRYRARLWEIFPFTKGKGVGWWFSELTQVFFIMIIGGAFSWFNPLNTKENFVTSSGCILLLGIIFLVYTIFLVASSAKTFQREARERTRNNV